MEAAAKARGSLVWQLKPEQIVTMQEEPRLPHRQLAVQRQPAI